VNQHRPHTPNTRMTVHDAARRLGISEDAVRMRVKRGTLAAEREGGRLYVLLTPDPTTERTDRTEELIDELRQRTRSLEEQLREERCANDEHRRLLAAALERIPALEAPRKPPGRPEDEEAWSEGHGMSPKDPDTHQPWHFQRYGAPPAEPPADAEASRMPQEQPEEPGPTASHSGAPEQRP
jgi:excisionase family DNA binding protein